MYFYTDPKSDHKQPRQSDSLPKIRPMKNLLHKILFVFLFLAAAIIPDEVQAQCNCEGGIPATPLSYYIILDTTDAPSSVISFPKFDPATGILNCVTFFDTLSLVSRSNVQNTASVPVTYRFLLNVTNEFSGPGISVDESSTRIYGPSLLSKQGDPGDSTFYGPDTLFKNSSHQTATSNVTGYMGLGTADFTYTVNGGLISTQGGLNYDYQIVSRYWGAFRLTYYWCPQSILATNIKNFVAVKSNKRIDISWITDNEETTNTYEIQISKDGRRFTGIGTKKADPVTQGASAKYAYQYNPDQIASGKLYVRIKQTDVNGKVSYSAIRVLDLDKEGASGFTLSPNPVVNRLGVQFDGILNGKYRLDLTNQVGQLIHSEALNLKNQSSFQLNLKNTAAPGIYYLRIKDENNTQVYTGKVMIQR